MKIGNYRRYSCNHTWHIDFAGSHLFVKATRLHDEAREERLGHKRIKDWYKVPRLRGATRIGLWTVTIYDRCSYIGCDRGLLLDEIVKADLIGCTASLDACLTEIFGNYKRIIDKTIDSVSLGRTICKLHGARVAKGGRLDKYYGKDKSWPVMGQGLRPSEISKYLLIIDEKSMRIDFGEVLSLLRDKLDPQTQVYAAITQGDPTDMNIGWSLDEGPVWFDFDTSGLNSLPGEFACFLMYQYLHGGRLSPRYNRAAFVDHQAVLLDVNATTRITRVKYNKNKLSIDCWYAPSQARLHVIRRYLCEIVEPTAISLGICNILDWLRPYILVRLLGVYNITDLDEDDAALSLSLIARILDPSATLTEILGLVPQRRKVG